MTFTISSQRNRCEITFAWAFILSPFFSLTLRMRGESSWSNDFEIKFFLSHLTQGMEKGNQFFWCRLNWNKSLTFYLGQIIKPVTLLRQKKKIISAKTIFQKIKYLEAKWIAVVADSGKSSDDNVDPGHVRQVRSDRWPGSRRRSGHTSDPGMCL